MRPRRAAALAAALLVLGLLLGGVAAAAAPTFEHAGRDGDASARGSPSRRRSTARCAARAGRDRSSRSRAASARSSRRSAGATVGRAPRADVPLVDRGRRAPRPEHPDHRPLAARPRRTARWPRPWARRSRVPYADTRFAWQTLAGDLVRLHWYEGSEAFGRAALAIGEKGVREAADVPRASRETEPDRLLRLRGPGRLLRRAGAGHARERRRRGALGHPDDVRPDRAGRRRRRRGSASIIPHELTHLVFDTAVRQPVSLPAPLAQRGRRRLPVGGLHGAPTAATSRPPRPTGGSCPCSALGGQFPTTYERFSLAYAESVSAVDFLVREKGTDALVSLVNSYADGVTDDEAFTAAVGTDVAGLRGGLARRPRRGGPGAGTAPSRRPPGPCRPAGTAAPRPQPAPAAPADTSPSGQGWVVILAAVAGLLVGGSVAYVLRRRARTEPGAPETSAWVARSRRIRPARRIRDRHRARDGGGAYDRRRAHDAEPPTRLESPAMLAGPGDEAP